MGSDRGQSRFAQQVELGDCHAFGSQYPQQGDARSVAVIPSIKGMTAKRRFRHPLKGQEIRGAG